MSILENERIGEKEPVTCRDCEHWESKEERERMSEIVLGKIEKLPDGQWHVTPADGRAEETFTNENWARLYYFGAEPSLINGLKDCRVHILKLDAKWFGLSAYGYKPWEIRLNDRDYRAGDHLIMFEVREGIAGRQVATGRVIVRDILMVAAPEGLAPGYVILSLGDAE